MNTHTHPSLPQPDDCGGTSDKRLVAILRQMIMEGKLAAGERVSEVSISSTFDVSRTPARLALRALEVEGLIRKREGRGYTVLRFEQKDLEKAYAVRGVLEGIAASTMAQSKVEPKTADRLRGLVERIDGVLSSQREPAEVVAAYQSANTQFHQTIMNKCGNEFIGLAFSRLQNLPLLGLGTVVFNRQKTEQELLRLRFANMQHSLILDAILRGDAFRAESLMREHANQIPVYTSVLL